MLTKFLDKMLGTSWNPADVLEKLPTGGTADSADVCCAPEKWETTTLELAVPTYDQAAEAEFARKVRDAHVVYEQLNKLAQWQSAQADASHEAAYNAWVKYINLKGTDNV